MPKSLIMKTETMKCPQHHKVLQHGLNAHQVKAFGHLRVCTAHRKYFYSYVKAQRESMSWCLLQLCTLKFASFLFSGITPTSVLISVFISTILCCSLALRNPVLSRTLISFTVSISFFYLIIYAQSLLSFQVKMSCCFSLPEGSSRYLLWPQEYNHISYLVLWESWKLVWW